MATAVVYGSGEKPRAWNPARVFLAVSAVVHLPLAAAGFFYELTYPIGAAEAAKAPSDHVFGVFETNGWHTLGALLVGVVSLVWTVRPARARAAALALGVGHIVLFGLLVVSDPSTYWIASNWADQVVHAFSAIGGSVSGLATREVSAARPRG